jgi:hypothetical protein
LEGWSVGWGVVRAAILIGKTIKYSRTPVSTDSASAVYRGPKKKIENYRRKKGS